VKGNLFAVDGLDGVLRAFNRMDKEGQRELRAEVQTITSKHAEAVNRAYGSAGDRRLAAQNAKAAKDRVPTITVGGAKKVGVRGGARAGDVLFGAEWGANPSGPNAWRFPGINPGPIGTVLFPALKGRQAQMVAEWERAVDAVARKWAR
jgi:hypothetical protein